VSAELLADVAAIEPGKSFRVGVRLSLPEGWHVYWRNPGDAGLATDVTIRAPEGFAVSPLRWPRPVRFTQPGEIEGFGYSEEVVLWATVSPPATLDADGKTVLTAGVDWLACKDKCVPGKASLAMELPHARKARPAPQHAKVLNEYEKRTPRLAPPVELTNQDGNDVSVHALLAEDKVRAVVLEWFNPDCPFIKRHHHQRDTFKDLHKGYAPRGVVFLAVNSTHYMTPQVTRDWHAKWNMPFDVLIDRDGAVGRAFRAKTTPHLFVIDTRGEIAYDGALDNDPRGRKDAEKRVDFLADALDSVLRDHPVANHTNRSYGCSVKYAPRRAKQDAEK
jgi:peroxiredoxin